LKFFVCFFNKINSLLSGLLDIFFITSLLLP
jgi:hypothetical protein